MTINLIHILVIIIFASLGWYTNEKLNSVPVLKNIVSVLIVVIAVLVLLASLGILGTTFTIKG